MQRCEIGQTFRYRENSYFSKSNGRFEAKRSLTILKRESCTNHFCSDCNYLKEMLDIDASEDNYFYDLRDENGAILKSYQICDGLKFKAFIKSEEDLYFLKV